MKAQVFLVGGTSCVGKSTFAARMGAELRWTVVSTDSLGRHPGRPWPTVPEAVAEFYDQLSEEAITWFLRVHHRNMAPGLIDLACQSQSRLIEGSALRPETMVSVDALGAALLWAPDDVIVRRVHEESRYLEQADGLQGRIDVFLRRTLAENRALREEALDCGVTLVDVGEAGSLDRLASEWRRRVS